jgi:hypothetical protein
MDAIADQSADTGATGSPGEPAKQASVRRQRPAPNGVSLPVGRKPGVPNRVTRTIREAVELASQPGACHPRGLAGWLIERAKGGIGDRQIFAGMVAKAMPLQVHQQVSGGIAIQLGWLQQRGIGAVATQSAERVPQVLDQPSKDTTVKMIANQIDDRTIVLSPVLPEAVALEPARQDADSKGQGGDKA